MNDTEDAPPPTPGPRGADAGGPRARRHLYRSRSDRKVAGVAGGLGDYFDLDPVIFRLGFVLLALMGGSGILAYLVAWIILPEGDSTRTDEPGSPGRTRLLDGVSPARIVAGGVLVFIGLAALVDLPRLGYVFPWSWPLILIAGGLAVLLWNQRRGARPDPETGPDHDPAPGPGPGPAPSTVVPPAGDDPGTRPGAPTSPMAIGPPRPAALLPAEPTQPDAPDDAPPDSSPPDSTPAGDTPAGDALGGDASPGDGAAGRGPPAPPAEPQRGPLGSASTTVATLGAVFLLWGVLALGHVANWWTASPVVVLGGALALCGAGLVASIWLGRALALIPVAGVLALFLAFFAWVDVPLDGGFGTEEHTFSEIGEVEPSYELITGKIALDLTAIDIDTDLALDTSVGVGEVVVDVPDDVDLVVDARSGIGEVVILDSAGREYSKGGVDSELRRALRPDGSSGAEVRLDAEVGIGKVEVRQVRDTSLPAASASASGT